MQSKLEFPDEVFTRDKIDVGLRGAIVLGGTCKDAAVFKKAASIPIRGLILSSMEAALIPLAEKMSFPIIVLEGFGNLALDPISFNLLSTHENRELSVNAEPYNPRTGERPEVIIPLPSSQELALPGGVEIFATGQRVRIVRNPYQAKTGTIELLYNELMEFPSGIQAPGARINLEDGESVTAPLANLEVIN